MRPANIIRPSKLTTTLPEDLRAKLDLHLWSELEQRVPVGAYQRFLVERIVEYSTLRRWISGSIWACRRVPGYGELRRQLSCCAINWKKGHDDSGQDCGASSRRDPQIEREHRRLMDQLRRLHDLRQLHL